MTQADSSLASVGNAHLVVEYHLDSGKVKVRRAGGQELLVNATARANTASGAHATCDAAYSRSATTTAFSDVLGQGKQLSVTCHDANRLLDFTLLFTLYDKRNALVMEVICQNVSDKPLNVHSLEPLRALPDEGGACLLWPETQKVLSNGKMYYDAGAVQDFEPGSRVQSWWNVCLFRGERQEGLVVGYLDNRCGMGEMELRCLEQATALVMNSGYAQGSVLSPGARLSSNRIILAIEADPFSALEAYAQAVGDLHQVKLANPPINGWCSWSYAYGAITEQEVLRQTRFAAQHLKPYGMLTMQVDDGFYRSKGDWEGNSRFPHGMKWLADQIRELGMRPGIWFAPYAIDAGSPVYEQHKEWLLRNRDGKLRPCGPQLTMEQVEAGSDHPDTAGLDITHPEAARWLSQLIATAAHEWGYDFIKIDFVDWTLLRADHFHDPGVTPAEAYRLGMQIMREAAGPNCHILDCGPGPVSVGLFDSMRIELDQPPVNWNQYFLQSASTAPAMAKRYYFHKRTWINDADHIVLAPLTLNQAQAAASLIALSGGNTISGDRLSDLDPMRLEILKKAFPSCGEAARPIDLFEGDRPSAFATRIKKNFGEWTVLGLFNADENHRTTKTVALERLGLDPAKSYLAYDFWKQRFHGEVNKELTLELEPASVGLLALHEKRGVPQVISTDRHIMQGAVELESVEWDAASQTLRGVSKGARGTDHRVYVYLPEAHPWVQGDPFYFYDFPGYTLKMMVMEPNIMSVHVRFDSSEQVAWQISLRDFFGRK